MQTGGRDGGRLVSSSIEAIIFVVSRIENNTKRIIKRFAQRYVSPTPPQSFIDGRLAVRLVGTTTYAVNRPTASEWMLRLPNCDNLMNR